MRVHCERSWLAVVKFSTYHKKFEFMLHCNISCLLQNEYSMSEASFHFSMKFQLLPGELLKTLGDRSQNAQNAPTAPAPSSCQTEELSMRWLRRREVLWSISTCLEPVFFLMCFFMI